MNEKQPVRIVHACTLEAQTLSSVLLVDDSEEIAYLVKCLLERRGHEVYLALSGEEALRQPNNGIIKDIPVYMFSVVTEKERVERWLAMGASGFIPKPFDVEQIVQVIERSQDRVHLALAGHGKGEAEG